MALSDTKKVQTMINIVGQQAEIIDNAVTAMEAVRTLYLAMNPDTTGTPLDGNVAAVNTAINSLRATIDGAAMQLMINSIVPSHRGEALN